MPAITTMVKTMGWGDSLSSSPIKALDPAAMDICMNPNKAEAVPAIWGNGRRAIAMELGSTRPSAVEKKIMGTI